MVIEQIKMKQTGISWIGEIPKDWEYSQIRGICYEKNSKTIDGEGELLSVSHYTGVTKKSDNIDLDNEHITNASTLEGYKIVNKNDLVINIMLAWQGALGVSEYDGITSPAYSVFGFYENAHLRYYHYLFRTKAIQTEFKRFSTGIIDSRLRLYPNIFLRIKTIVPPLSIQEKIASFLDQKTNQINTFIKNKKRLIELLEEQKISIINKAVTKGLDENVKMKDSGIPWIGEIPEDWEKWKISRIFKNIGSGTTPESGNKDYYENGTIKWVNTGDLNDSYLYDCEKSVTELALNKFSALKMFEENSLIIAMYGATIGKLGILQFKATTNQACCVLSNSNISDIKYIYYWFLSNKEHIIRMGYGGGQPNISQDLIKSIKVPLPKLNIQINIVEYLDVEIEKINNAIQKIEKEISLIEEYRDSLIYHAVTGKLNIG